MYISQGALLRVFLTKNSKQIKVFIINSLQLPSLLVLHALLVLLLEECFSPSRLVAALSQFQIYTSHSSPQQSQYSASKLWVNFLKKQCLHVTLHISTVALRPSESIKNNLSSLFSVSCAELEVHITLNFKDL